MLQFPTILVGFFVPFICPLADDDVCLFYDPNATLESLDVPQLWILAAKDHSAPSEQTIRILRDLQARKPNLDIVVFRTADHGMVETYNWEDQQRRRYSAGYFDLIVEWISTQQARQITPDMVVFDGTP
jgi:dienelactone hydrolase